jgi:hypothetical protein
MRVVPFVRQPTFPHPLASLNHGGEAGHYAAKPAPRWQFGTCPSSYGRVHSAALRKGLPE